MTGNDIAMFWFGLMLAVGGMLQCAGFVVRVFDPGAKGALVFGVLGTGVWILAVATFFFFWADPQPKHLRRR